MVLVTSPFCKFCLDGNFFNNFCGDILSDFWCANIKLWLFDPYPINPIAVFIGEPVLGSKVPSSSIKDLDWYNLIWLLFGASKTLT